VHGAIGPPLAGSVGAGLLVALAVALAMGVTGMDGERPGNRLAQERSLYLRQHAQNPLDWYPWGDDAFTKARAENRPIFLSVGYSSCHWCHVMEREVFEDEEVAEFLNAHFVSIKVDREERPDVDAVYMEAVQRMTGGGGWPMSVFLLPDGRPFFGGTYFPKPHFLALARRIHEVWDSQQRDIEAQAAALAETVAADPIISRGTAVGRAMVENAASAGAAAWDPQWGGVRARMKFPTPLRWHFLLRHWRRSGEQRSAQVVHGTLRPMAAGGIHDHVGGGFHRYTVEETWLVPHFEKMLYDNALLAALYTEAAVALEEPLYEEVARDTLDFLLRDMRDPRGGFYGSFDADSGGEEGSFYVWTPDELRAVAGEDGPALAMLLGVTPGGNFEGKSIPTRRLSAAEVGRVHGLDVGDVQSLFDRWREPLRTYRAGRVWPGLDRKVITAWNGLAISAFAMAYRAFGDERYRAAAEQAADFLWERHRRPDGSLLRASNDGVAANEAVLDDYAFFAEACLDLHQATGSAHHLRRALALLDVARTQFRHPEAGWYLVREGHDTPLGRQVELFDHATPSGQSVLLHALLRAAALTGSEAWRRDVEETLAGRAEVLHRAGMEMAWWYDAAQLLQGPFYEVVIAGDPADERTDVLVRTVQRLLPAHAVLVRVPAAGPDTETTALLPPTEGKTARSGVPTAYVCQFGTCKRPVTEAAALRDQLMEGWYR